MCRNPICSAASSDVVPSAVFSRLRRLATLGLSLALLLSCAEPPPPPTLRLRLTSGTRGAGFHPLGESLARAYRRAFPDATITVTESAGSVHNVEAINRNEADLGLAFADVVYMAFSGKLEEAAMPLEHLRGIAVLQINPLHLVARADASISSVNSLRGRRVGLGPPGSGTALTAAMVLNSFGLRQSDVGVRALPFKEAASQLVDGRLDAMFVDASYPAESVIDAARSGARLVAIEGEAIEQLRQEYPFFRLTSIPAATYPGHPNAVHTIGVDSVLVCRSTLSDELAYELTRAFFDALPTLASEQPSLRLMDLEQAAATPIPLHGGAARFYRERELRR